MATVISASATGATYLILIQVVSRASTFIINQSLLRVLSPELLGAASQLELYAISVLYFARESLRVALQRQQESQQAAINTSYLTLLLGLPLAFTFAVFYIRSGLPHVPYIHGALKLYASAAIIELASEPCFVVVQQKMAYHVRARAETAATIARGIFTLLVVYLGSRRGYDLGVMPFALGQFFYACTLTTVYYILTLSLARAEKLSIFLRHLPANDDLVALYLSRPLLALALSLYIQSGIKYVLTQGDSILITTMATLSEQGAYALASNYGGLVARMIFQPIEESSRTLFARLCSSPAGVTRTESDISQAQVILRDIIKSYNILALVSWTVGPSLAPRLLHLLVGRKWTDTGAGDVLATYCYYIPLLAINGITEAFVSAVATSADLQRQSIFMGAYFFGFALAAYVFLGVLELGAQGLVWANCVNMVLRILFNSRYILIFFDGIGQSFPFSTTLPTTNSVIAAGVATALLRRDHLVNESLVIQLLGHIALAGSFTLILLVLERKFCVRCYGLFTGRGAKIQSKSNKTAQS